MSLCSFVLIYVYSYEKSVLKINNKFPCMDNPTTGVKGEMSLLVPRREARNRRGLAVRTHRGRFTKEGEGVAAATK